MQESNLFFLDDFGRFIPWTITYFLEVSAHISLKVVINGFLEIKNLKNSTFEAIILK